MGTLTHDDVTIAVCTYGADTWRELAEYRALPSAETQGTRVLHIHADTLHDARNGALSHAATSHIIYLDADDELEADYVTHLLAGSADLRAPSVRYVQGERARGASPRMPHVAGHNHHECGGECLPFGNWIVVGALAPIGLLQAAGGWHDWPCFEDWDLWARCWQHGCTVEPIHAAIYRAHVRHDSRNRAGTVQARNEVHRRIARDLGLPVPD